jgi:hypothetical protein
MIETIAIFLIALFTLWGAALIGLALGIDPVPLMLVLTTGYALSVAAITMMGAPLRDHLLSRLGWVPDCTGRVGRITQRYGVIGLALIAPVLTGAVVGAALGLTLRIAPTRLAAGMIAGAALWSALLTLGVVAL